jgi:hypothetical protein
MNNVVDFLKKAADRTGFTRDRFNESKIPTEFSGVSILPFFGDMRSCVVLSSLILKRYREELKSSKYFIMASWPGMQGLFPYCDEYWSINDESQIKKFYENSEGFKNKSDLSTIYLRNLNEFFRDVVDYKELEKLYNNGLTNDFFEKFKDIKRYLPFIPSGSILGKDFNKSISTSAGYKVFIHPSIFFKQWHIGKSINVRSKREFWVELIEYLIDKGFMPVIWQNFMSYDLSQEFHDKCIYLNENDVIRAMSAMRSTGMVLDVFTGLSRLAILARCPYLAIDERSRYNNQKEFEINNLCSINIPNEYIFSFATILSSGTVYSWKNDIFQSIVKRLEKIMPELNREEWPSTGEANDFVSYKKMVYEQKKKKIGTKFFKIPKD